MSRNRTPPQKKTVGSGITQYEREETAFDKEHLESARSEALTKSGLKFSTAPSIQQLKEQMFALCRKVYSEEGKPDPFTSSHPRKQFRDVPFEELERHGHNYLEKLTSRGMMLNAIHHCPPEDEHSRLWYASRIAQLLFKLEVDAGRMGDGGLFIDHDGDHIRIPYELSTWIIARDGWELGHLWTEYHFKFDYEQKVLSRIAQDKAAEKNAEALRYYNEDASENAVSWRAHAENLLQALEGKHSDANKARLIITRWDSLDVLDVPEAPRPKTLQNWLSERKKTES